MTETDQLLTIGWGSAETQFQGSAGKQNCAKQAKNNMPVPIRDEFDDKRVIVSWRADAQFFTVKLAQLFNFILNSILKG